MRWPVAVRPSPSRPQKASRSGDEKVAWGMSRSSRWRASELPSSGDLDVYPRTDAPTPPPTATPSSAKSPLIFVNGADTKAAQIFTVIHELAHLYLGESALSDASMGTVSSSAHEVWCNKV